MLRLWLLKAPWLSGAGVPVPLLHDLWPLCRISLCFVLVSSLLFVLGT